VSEIDKMAEEDGAALDEIARQADHGALADSPLFQPMGDPDLEIPPGTQYLVIEVPPEYTASDELANIYEHIATALHKTGDDGEPTDEMIWDVGIYSGHQDAPIAPSLMNMIEAISQASGPELAFQWSATFASIIGMLRSLRLDGETTISLDALEKALLMEAMEHVYTPLAEAIQHRQEHEAGHHGQAD